MIFQRNGVSVDLHERDHSVGRLRQRGPRIRALQAQAGPESEQQTESAVPLHLRHGPSGLHRVHCGAAHPGVLPPHPVHLHVGLHLQVLRLLQTVHRVLLDVRAGGDCGGQVHLCVSAFCGVSGDHDEEGQRAHNSGSGDGRHRSHAQPARVRSASGAAPRTLLCPQHPAPFKSVIDNHSL